MDNASMVLAMERAILRTLPVAYLPLWKRDGSASFSSDDGYGHTCTVTGGVTWGTMGRSFDMTDGRVQIGAAADTELQFLTDTTICIWVRMNTKVIGAQYLISKSNIAAQDRFYVATGTNSGWRVYIEHDDSAKLSADNVGTATVGEWYFLTLRFGSGGQKLDVNLVNIASDADTGVLRTGTHVPLYLGLSYNNDSPMGGTIGEVIIYNRYLPDPELAMLYTATKWRYRI